MSRQELNLNSMNKAAGGAKDPIVRITVNYEDEGGRKYTFTVNNGKQMRGPDDLIKGMKVTCTDGNGHVFTTTAKQ